MFVKFGICSFVPYLTNVTNMIIFDTSLKGPISGVVNNYPGVVVASANTNIESYISKRGKIKNQGLSQGAGGHFNAPF